MLEQESEVLPGNKKRFNWHISKTTERVERSEPANKINTATLFDLLNLVYFIISELGDCTEEEAVDIAVLNLNCQDKVIIDLIRNTYRSVR